MTALLGEAALFIPGSECSFPVAASDFDRLISGHRLIGGPLLYCEYSRTRKQYYDHLSYSSRIRESKMAASDRFCFGLDSSGPSSYRHLSRFFHSFSLFLEAVGVRKHCYIAVESWLEARCFVRSPRETRESRPTCPRQTEVGGVGLGPKPPKLRWWRCAQPRAAKATPSISVLGNCHRHCGLPSAVV